MAMGWRGVVSEQADLIFSRLGQLVASSLRFLHDELGIDLGIKPDLYPFCGLVCAAVIGGFVALLVWLAACGGRKRKHGAATNQSSVKPNVNVIDSVKTEQIKPVKTEEPKKKNRKKAADKQKTQSNGGTIPETKQEVKVAQELQKKQPQPAPAPPQPPADIKVEKAKKSKKKPKLEVKQPQGVSATDGKEPDEGAWETKISNREKRQQRRKEKGPGDESGSPGGDGHVSRQAEQPSVPASISTKKNKGNKDSSSKAAKGDPIVTPVPSTWNAVNSGGWAEMTVKVPPQVTPSDGEKWHVGMKTSVHRNAEPLAWGQESEAGSLTTVDGRIKKELNQVNFSLLGLSPAAGDLVIQPAAELRKWDGFPPADEWSGCNGLGAGDPNSDWDAPSEVWGNYEEPKVETPAAQEKPVPQQTKLHESDDDKEKGEPSGNGKSKRRKKKKKTPEAENASSQANAENVVPQSQGEAKGKSTKGLIAPAVSGVVKPHSQLPVDEPTKQSVTPLSNQKKSDQNWEPPKQVQKKKARRET